MLEYLAVEHKTPIDFIEPLKPNEYRQVSLAYLRIVSLAMTFVIGADDPLAASVGAAFALGLTSVLDNKSMADYAREIGVHRATISGYAKRFGRMADLPPSALMLSQKRVNKSRTNREKKLQ
jgi:hypothetical protein